MPELPEVETLKRQLEKRVKGKIIKDVDIFSQKNFIGKKEEIIGKKINEINRFGKVLSLKLVNIKNQTSVFLNIHLKLTGELLYADDVSNAVFKEIIPFTKTNRMPAKTTRGIIKFIDGSGLFFNDLRKFGWMKVKNMPEIPRGVDILSQDFTLDFFSKIIKKSKKPIKTFLMDQEKIAGIGNIYANEALFLAKIHPKREANSLIKSEIRVLFKSIKKIIEQSIKHGGSSSADESFIQLDGTKGKHQRFFLVYQRENLPCKACGELIKRVKHFGRSSFFCPNCQH